MLMIRNSKSAEETEIGMRWLNDAADRGHFYARSKLVFLKLEDLKKEESPRISYAFRLIANLIAIKIEIYAERKRNKYSDKVL